MIRYVGSYSGLWYAIINLYGINLSASGETKEKALDSLLASLPNYIVLYQQSVDKLRQLLHEHCLGVNSID